MKGKKGSTDEGGVRAPCLIRWPGRIQPGTHDTVTRNTIATDWVLRPEVPQPRKPANTARAPATFGGASLTARQSASQPTVRGIENDQHSSPLEEYRSDTKGSKRVQPTLGIPASRLV